MMPFFVRNTLKIKEMFFILTDKRLLKCAKMVSGKGKVCDVGTDHAYLPAYLVKNGICESAVAADIADGPLRSAKATLEKGTMYFVYSKSSSISLNKGNVL